MLHQGRRADNTRREEGKMRGREMLKLKLESKGMSQGDEERNKYRDKDGVN